MTSSKFLPNFKNSAALEANLLTQRRARYLGGAQKPLRLGYSRELEARKQPLLTRGQLLDQVVQGVGAEAVNSPRSIVAIRLSLLPYW